MIPVDVFKVFTGPQGILARLAVMAVLGAAAWGHGFWKGNEHGTQKLIDYQAEQAKADTRLAAARVVVTEQVRIKYRDRIKVVEVAGETITREVPIYVTKEDDAAAGSVPVGAVRVFNAAWSGTPPGPPAGTDRGPSGYPLSALTEADAANARTCRVWKEQRDGLIELYKRQQAIERSPP